MAPTLSGYESSAGKMGQVLGGHAKDVVLWNQCPRQKLLSIEIPVLIIRGNRDMIKLDHSVAIFQSLKNGQLCIYPNAGHKMPDEKLE